VGTLNYAWRYTKQKKNSIKHLGTPLIAFLVHNEPIAIGSHTQQQQQQQQQQQSLDSGQVLITCHAICTANNYLLYQT